MDLSLDFDEDLPGHGKFNKLTGFTYMEDCHRKVGIFGTNSNGYVIVVKMDPASPSFQSTYKVRFAQGNENDECCVDRYNGFQEQYGLLVVPMFVAHTCWKWPTVLRRPKSLVW